VDYRPDRRATGVWLRTDPQLRRITHDVADRIVAAARGIAPVDDGEYLAGLRAVDAPVPDRVGAAAEATAGHSAAVEFGNTQTRGRAQAVLQRATDMAS
jgi:hypothetical protein